MGQGLRTGRTGPWVCHLWASERPRRGCPSLTRRDPTAMERGQRSALWSEESGLVCPPWFKGAGASSQAGVCVYKSPNT